jgi:hypothetical protein
VVIVVGAGLLAAACGGGSASPGVASAGSTTSTTPVAVGGSGSSNYADAVAYANCMRSHGVGNFPDPTTSGDFIFSGSGSSNPINSPSFSSADKACTHLLPNGGQPTAAQQSLQQAKALKYAECMRAHGVLNYPDPSPSSAGGSAGINLGGNESIDHNTPQFTSAFKTCTKALNLQAPHGP